MSKQILPRPAALITQLRTMVAALDKYADTYTPVSPTKAELESNVAELVTALQNQVQSAGAAEKATKDLYTIRDKSVDLLRRMRDAVYAYFGKSDPRIVEFGLDTLKAHRSKNGNDSTPTTE